MNFYISIIVILTTLFAENSHFELKTPFMMPKKTDSRVVNTSEEKQLFYTYILGYLKKILIVIAFRMFLNFLIRTATNKIVKILL